MPPFNKSKSDVSPMVHGRPTLSAKTISQDSVFDWGSGRGEDLEPSSALGDSIVTTRVEKRAATAMRSGKNHGSRFNFNSTKRLSDINDLVDDSTDDGEDDSIVESAPNAGKRQLMLLLSFLAIIVSAICFIRFVIANRSPYVMAEVESRGGIFVPGQQLLEIAESVITACSEEQLNKDMAECQHLCHASLCCFENDEYSCEEDEGKDCAVYAGCEALIQGIPLQAIEEDEGYS